MQMDINHRVNKKCDKDRVLSSQIKYSHTKIVSRLLLAVCLGLFLIALVIYIVFRQYCESNTINNSVISHTIEENVDSPNESTKQFGLLTDQSLILDKKQGCYELSCSIDCIESKSVYADVARVMNASNCKVFRSLVLYNQVDQFFENNWVEVNNSVLKIALIRGEVYEIKSGAFISKMFSSVIHMIWIQLRLNEISHGALLGLNSLNKLEIDFKAPSLGLNFLKPVQTTLTDLKINCGILFKSDSSVFDNMHLEKLTHLDLSYNTFSGPLTKNIFSATPNVTYLFLKHCSITAIEDNLFEDIATNLKLVDLKHNLLTQINPDMLGVGQNLILFDIEPNNWHCNCQLRPLIKFFNENKSIFTNAPYCRMPPDLYGKKFDELNPTELQCDPSNTTNNETNEGAEPSELDNRELFYNEYQNADPTITIPFGPILQFSCTQAIPITTDGQEFYDRQERGFAADYQNSAGFISENFVFEPPNYDLNLEILQNYSVRAYIDNYDVSDKLNIIWFTENNIDTYVETSLKTDYNCMEYKEPYLVTYQLQQNHTYTFCMMSVNSVVVSPLFCQPLHIPMSSDYSDTSDTLTAESDKLFTIAMLCLIFFISTIFGAIFAYLGIKAFPHLLESSDNVVVIKEADEGIKTCCVSTISESHYAKSSLCKRRPHKSSIGIIEEPSTDVYLGPTDSKISTSDSIRSSSTLFEECFSNIEDQTIEYEMPIPFNESCTGLNSPPPLPKRNSRVSLYSDQAPLPFENFVKPI